MHLVIATREDPPLPLARLRARGELTELRAADLRFTPQEAADFLSRAMGLSLPEDDVASLERRTEGWIAGLQLAALSMQGHQDVHGFINAFAGDNRYVVDYLIEEVLDRQPQEVHAFLLQTSVLDRLNGSLCDAVCFGAMETDCDSAESDRAHTGAAHSDTVEEHSGQAILETLERGNLFVVPLDDTRSWFRYHHLFADVLHARLLDELPEVVPELHGRAAEWYERNGMRADAIRHALAAEDFERAAALVELAWPEMDGSFQPATWLKWKIALPDDIVRHRPILSVAHAWALLDGGEMEAGEAQLRAAEQLLDAPSSELIVVDDEQFRTLPASVATAHAYHAQAHGDGAATIRHSRTALDLLTPQDHVRRGPPAALMSLAYWAEGQLEEAAEALSDAMAEFELAGHVVFAISGTFGLADIRLAQGRMREARRIYERSLRLAEQDGAPVVRGVSYIHLGLSELLRETNDLAAVDATLAQERRAAGQASLDEFPVPLPPRRGAYAGGDRCVRRGAGTAG